jgi:hypothetical protein
MPTPATSVTASLPRRAMTALYFCGVSLAVLEGACRGCLGEIAPAWWRERQL